MNKSIYDVMEHSKYSYKKLNLVLINTTKVIFS